MTDKTKIDEGIPPLMSLAEIGEMYGGMTRQGVLAMIKRGQLPARKVGGTWVVRREVAESITADGVVLDGTDIDATPTE